MISSYSKKGYPWANACIESFHSLIKREWLRRFKIRNHEEAYRYVFEYINTFYNTIRIHSHCGFLSPDQHERKHECRELGLEMSIQNLDKRDQDFELRVRSLKRNTTDGIIILGNEMKDDDYSLIEGIKAPLLVIDYMKDDRSFNSIMSNNTESAMGATEYLVAMGHRQIGYIRGEFRIKPFIERSRGWQLAMHRYKIPIEKKFIITLPTTMDGAYKKMKEYLEKRPPLPTGFFVDNDIIALGVIKALNEMGYRVPDDISLVGYDDLPYSAVSQPALTTIRVGKEEMGRIAVRRLYDVMTHNEPCLYLQIELCTSFIERDSVRDIRGL